MEKIKPQNILIAFLAGVTIFSVYLYFSSLRERRDLAHNLTSAREQVQSLEIEKQNLLENIKKEKDFQQGLMHENDQLVQDLEAAEEKLIKLDSEFTEAKKTIGELNTQVTALKSGNEQLAASLTQTVQERDMLKVKVSSISELKKTLRDLKREMWKAKLEVFTRRSSDDRLEGNRGFLVRNGKPTYPAKIRIEVSPASLPE